MRQSISADVSINSNLSNAKVTIIMIFQTKSLRCDQAEMRKSKRKASNSCSNEFQIRRKARFRVRMNYKSKENCEFELLTTRKISCSNDFVSVFGCASDVIVDKYSNIDNARILEFDSWNDWAETYSRIWCKQWRRFSMFEFVHCRKFCAIQVRQKLVISDMSRRHWHDEKKILWHKNCLYVSSSFKKNVRAEQFLDRTFWWKHQKAHVDRIKNEMIHRTSSTISTCKHDQKLRDTNHWKHLVKIWTCKQESRNTKSSCETCANCKQSTDISSEFQYIFRVMQQVENEIQIIARHLVRIEHTKEIKSRNIR